MSVMAPVETRFDSSSKSLHARAIHVAAEDTPKRPGIELSVLGKDDTGRQEEQADRVPSPEEAQAIRSRQIGTERLQLFALCWALFLAGFNDASTGPLLPRIQKVYGVCRTIICTSEYQLTYVVRLDTYVVSIYHE
jgi:hypothetical protein